MKKSLAFTLAEVLITLAIIGVVAAMTIPSVIVNTNQSEFKTGLRKAVSVLNSSITMNNALEGETPHDNANLFGYLQQHMSVLKSTTILPFAKTKNYAFYTTDGMRFEFPTTDTSITTGIKTHEAKTAPSGWNNYDTTTKSPGKCGSNAGEGYPNPNELSEYPCLIIVDVNGDRKPNPADPNSEENVYSYPGPNEKLLKDVFTIMITDEKAVPFGVAAQKAMYQAAK